MGKKITKVEDVNRPIEIVINKNKTPLEASTEFLLKPSLLAAKVIDSDKKQLSKDLIDLQYAQALIERGIDNINKGNLEDIEGMLYSNACALNVVFTTLMTRANRQEYMPSTQALMTLAFKAQNQCRSTLQTLIDLKQPRQSTFVKQANIAQGHQQVNNLAEKNLDSQNKLLGSEAYDMDSDSKTEAKGINPNMEAMGKVYRRKNC